MFAYRSVEVTRKVDDIHKFSVYRVYSDLARIYFRPLISEHKLFRSDVWCVHFANFLVSAGMRHACLTSTGHCHITECYNAYL